MDIFDVLTLLGGLALFLFGMDLTSSSLARSAGNRLKKMLATMTSSPIKGFVLGFGVTALLQSSSASTVMLVGFVNSGIMTLHQSVSIIFGANLGSALMTWITSLSGINGKSFFLRLLMPTSFTPVLALIGIILYMFQKNPKKKDVGAILIGFAILMYGMEAMSDAVSGLKDLPQFTHLLLLFSNPVLGVLVGTFFTAAIQSSAASVGILQALSLTCAIPCGTCIPIIMGQNIGTCISAILGAIGTSKNAHRVAAVHLLFNVVATLILLPLWCLAEYLFKFPFASVAASPLVIALMHTVFKIIAIFVLWPLAGFLEKLAHVFVKDAREDEELQLLDDRLIATPSVAIDRCNTVAVSMAELSFSALRDSLSLLDGFDEKLAEKVRETESKVDFYEDKIGSYLVELSAQEMNATDSSEDGKLLRLIGDFERISDHAVNILESCEEMHDKKLTFSGAAQGELTVMVRAVSEIMELALTSFRDEDLGAASRVEPLEQVVDSLREQIRAHHIARLQSGECTIELGFILTDLLTNLERVSDHCSNIAGCVLEMSKTGNHLDLHAYLDSVKDGTVLEYNNDYEYYSGKYSLPAQASPVQQA